jgi:hypothetical protein
MCRLVYQTGPASERLCCHQREHRFLQQRHCSGPIDSQDATATSTHNITYNVHLQLVSIFLTARLGLFASSGPRLSTTLFSPPTTGLISRPSVLVAMLAVLAVLDTSLAERSVSGRRLRRARSLMAASVLGRYAMEILSAEPIQKKELED